MGTAYDCALFRYPSKNGSPADPVMAASQPHSEDEHAGAVECHRPYAGVDWFALAISPQASESELRRKLASLLLREELARKVYGESSHVKSTCRILHG